MKKPWLSLLQAKINEKLFQQVFIDAHVIKWVTSMSIGNYLEKPTVNCLNSIFKPDSKLRAPAKKIAEKNFTGLRKLVDDYPDESFLDKAETAKLEKFRATTRKSTLIASAVLLLLLIASEQDYAVLKAFGFGFIACYGLVMPMLS